METLQKYKIIKYCFDTITQNKFNDDRLKKYLSNLNINRVNLTNEKEKVLEFLRLLMASYDKNGLFAFISDANKKKRWKYWINWTDTQTKRNCVHRK